MEKHTLHIAFGIVPNFFHPLCVTAISILENNPDTAIEFHVFAFFLPWQDQEILKKLENQYQTPFHIHIIDEDMFCAQYPGGKNVLLLRFLMADTLRGQTDRFLYLDADMVCTGSLQELLYLNLEGYVAAVVADVPRMVIRQSAALNLQTKRYFNAGFMLINIHEWRIRNTCNECMNHLVANHAQLDFFDQDVLNVVIGNNVIYIDRKFNFICDLGVPNKLIPPDTRIIHYAGKIKPWHPYNINPLANTWLSYHSRLSWESIEQKAITVPREMRLLSKYLFRTNRKKEGIIAWILYIMMKLKLLKKSRFHNKLKGTIA
ncbi:MAG: glycosyltransferase family 8 protein [Oxalobacter formigenes]|nr:glycosyltransferase family 8 protein [Oxalobacter formigenes]